jgi:general secretion pathway protein F
MESREGVFTRFYLNMIRAGEAGGALDVVLQRLTEFMERSRELRDTVKSALIYPAILVGVSVLSVAILLMWVVPQFSQMFEESGKALPLATQIVIAAGDGVRSYWWLMVLGGFSVYIWFARQLREPVSRYRWDRRILGLPLVGDLVGKLEVARFSRTLGTLIGNGVSLLAAISIVKETLGNSVMADALGEVARQLKEGKGLGQPLMEAGLFPKLAVHLVMVGEETGKLQEMLIRIADIYDREVHTSVKRMLALMEPVLILGLGLVIGGIIMSILVAILSVNDLAM